MPKLPLPPRTAQNSSGSLSAQTRRSRPSAVTISTACTWSAAKPKLAAERAHAAAEGVADDADVGRRAAQPGEPVVGGGLEDPLPLHAGLDAGDAALGVDGEALHPAGGDHQRAGGVADRPVPGGLDGDAQVVRDGPGDGGGDVVGAGGADRDGRGVLDGDVPGGDLGGHAVVARGVDRAVDLAAQLVDGAGRERRHEGVEDRVAQDGGRQRLGLLGETHQGVFLFAAAAVAADRMARGGDRAARSDGGRVAAPPWRILASRLGRPLAGAGPRAKGVPPAPPAWKHAASCASESSARSRSRVPTAARWTSAGPSPGRC